MMLHKKYFLRLSLLLAISAIASCANVQDRVIVKTEYITNEIKIKERPKPVTLYDIKFYAVTTQNTDDFLEKFVSKNGDVAYFAISVTDYEKLSLNIAELRRFIEQQKALIVYYETNINMNNIMYINPDEKIVEEGTISKIKTKLGM